MSFCKDCALISICKHPVDPEGNCHGGCFNGISYSDNQLSIFDVEVKDVPVSAKNASAS